MARSRGRDGRRPWAVVLWIGVLVSVLATVGLQFVVGPQLADDPRVGPGRLDAPAVAPTPQPVLQPLGEPTASVDAAALASRIGALPREGLGDVAALVVDARTGAELYRSGSGVRTPASSLKVLSGLVALDVLGPERRFVTGTHLSADGRLVLRGGGDPLLAGVQREGYPHLATLADLATATANALRTRGVTSVPLGYDATLFAGPGWNPAWPEVFRRSVAPVSALTVDHARPSLAPDAFDRHPDPAAFAAQRFAEQLQAAGITVTGVAATVTPADAVELARVESLPVGVLVERALTDSDNDAAETLLWHTALARGRPATPTDAAAVLAQELAARGLWSEGMAVQDGAGIPIGNQVTPDALVGAVRLAIENPRLRAVATGLPVAGVSGTLTGRFVQDDALAARGVVRAKTGTIQGVNTLTGYTVTAGGQPVAFAFMTSGGAGQTSARAWLDRVSAALASCGC